MYYIQLSYLCNLEQFIVGVFHDTDIFEVYRLLILKNVLLWLFFDQVVLHVWGLHVLSFLIMKKGIRSKMPEWRWGRDTVARSAVLGALAVDWAWASAAGSEGRSSTPVSWSGTSVQVVQVLCVSSSSPCLFCFVCSELCSLVTSNSWRFLWHVYVTFPPSPPPHTHHYHVHIGRLFKSCFMAIATAPLCQRYCNSVSVMEYSFSLVMLVT